MVVGVAAAEEGEMEAAAAVVEAEVVEVVEEDVSTVHFLLTITSSHSPVSLLITWRVMLINPYHPGGGG